jgi:hypothetical protein
MEDKVDNPVLDTHHSVEAVVGGRTAPDPNVPMPPSLGACLEATVGGGSDRTRATTTTKTNDSTDDSNETAANAMIALVLLHFSEGDEESEDPTGFDSPSESEELEEEGEQVSLSGNKEKDKTGLSPYEKLRLAKLRRTRTGLGTWVSIKTLHHPRSAFQEN